MTSLTQQLKQYHQGLLPAMVTMKYKLMRVNIFRFYRGTCFLFYNRLANENLPEAPHTWISGDLHLENFGSYRATNGLVHFDLNDFDEAVLAPCTWELTRILTSILIAFRTLGVEERKAEKMVQLFLRTYAATLANGKPGYVESKTAKGIIKTFLKQAARKNTLQLLHKRTNVHRKELTLMMEHPKHMELDWGLKQQLTDFMNDWIHHDHDGPFNYEVRDVAFRLAGTGSVGLKRYAFLLQGRRKKDDFLLVDMKQARPSCLLPYVTAQQPAWTTEAERIVAIQNRMQNVPPALLSHTMFNEDAYIIQEMQPEKDSINFNLIKDHYRDIYEVIDNMAMLTASSQLRSGGRQGSAITDELIEFGNRTDWQETVVQIAMDYTQKSEADFITYLKATDKEFSK